MTNIQIIKGSLTYFTMFLICVFPFVVEAGFGAKVIIPFLGVIAGLCYAVFASFYFGGGLKELKKCTGIELMLDEE